MLDWCSVLVGTFPLWLRCSRCECVKLHSGSQGDALVAICAAVRDSISAHSYTLTLTFAEYVGTPNDKFPLAAQLAVQPGTGHVTVMVRKFYFIEQRKQLLCEQVEFNVYGDRSCARHLRRQHMGNPIHLRR